MRVCMVAERTEETVIFCLVTESLREIKNLNER